MLGKSLEQIYEKSGAKHDLYEATRFGISGTVGLVVLDLIYSAVSTVDFNGFTKVPGFSLAEFQDNYAEHPIFNIFTTPKNSTELFTSIGKVAVAALPAARLFWKK